MSDELLDAKEKPVVRYGPSLPKVIAGLVLIVLSFILYGLPYPWPSILALTGTGIISGMFFQRAIKSRSTAKVFIVLILMLPFLVTWFYFIGSTYETAGVFWDMLITSVATVASHFLPSRSKANA